jgi:DNA-binding response OmpR family regulator
MPDLIVSGTTRTPKPARLETPPRFRVLSVSPMPQDHLMLRHALDAGLWQVLAVATRRGALGRLRANTVSVIVCESVLEDGTWRDLLEYTRACADAPPLIVTSRLADEHLWSEVLNLGGYDVLAKPLSDQEVRHVLQTVALRQAQALPRTRAAGAA